MGALLYGNNTKKLESVCGEPISWDHGNVAVASNLQVRNTPIRICCKRVAAVEYIIVDLRVNIVNK